MIYSKGTSCFNNSFEVWWCMPEKNVNIVPKYLITWNAYVTWAKLRYSLQIWSFFFCGQNDFFVFFLRRAPVQTPCKTCFVKACTQPFVESQQNENNDKIIIITKIIIFISQDDQTLVHTKKNPQWINSNVLDTVCTIEMCLYQLTTNQKSKKFAQVCLQQNAINALTFCYLQAIEDLFFTCKVQARFASPSPRIK